MRTTLTQLSHGALSHGTLEIEEIIEVQLCKPDAIERGVDLKCRLREADQPSSARVHSVLHQRGGTYCEKHNLRL